MARKPNMKAAAKKMRTGAGAKRNASNATLVDTQARRTPTTGSVGASGKSSDVLAARRASVRMYRLGVGDCFLVSLPRADGTTFRMLIDCGVHQSQEGGGFEVDGFGQRDGRAGFHAATVEAIGPVLDRDDLGAGLAVQPIKRHAAQIGRPDFASRDQSRLLRIDLGRTGHSAGDTHDTGRS